MSTIERWMTASPHTIGHDISIAVARRRMDEHKIRHLPVLAGGHLVGVVSDRDLLRFDTLVDVDTSKLNVEEAMTIEPFVVDRTTPLYVAVQEMARRKLGTAIVVDGSRVVGIFTSIDALRALLELEARPPAER